MNRTRQGNEVPRIILLSFSNSSLSASSRRLSAQARQTGLYDEVRILNESDLSSGFQSEFGDRLIAGSKGFGFYSWKPQLILQTLQESQFGDLIHWLDVGSHLRPEKSQRLEFLFHIAASAESGVLAFEAPKIPALLLNPLYRGARMLEYQWTKADVFKFFGVLANPAITHTEQIAAGTIILRNCAESHKLVSLWTEVIRRDFSLIDDSPSSTPNFPGFVEHRHDQSLFSVVGKMFGITTLSWRGLDTVTENARSLLPIEIFSTFSALSSPIRHLRDRENS